MFEDLDIEKLLLSIALAAFVTLIMYAMPQLLNLKGYKWWVILTVGIALVPITYYILSRY